MSWSVRRNVSERLRREIIKRLPHRFKAGSDVERQRRIRDRLAFRHERRLQAFSGASQTFSIGSQSALPEAQALIVGRFATLA